VKATEFNINNAIHVRLTPAGLRYHKEAYDEFQRRYRMPSLEYNPPRMVEGYYEFQLWEFMKIYGPHVDRQRDEAPFVGMDILIPEERQWP